MSYFVLNNADNVARRNTSTRSVFRDDCGIVGRYRHSPCVILADFISYSLSFIVYAFHL